MVTRCPLKSASALNSPPVARNSNTAVSVVNVMPVVSPPIAIRPALTVPTHSPDVPSAPLAFDMDCSFGWAEDVTRGEGTSGVTGLGEQPTMSMAKQTEYTALVHESRVLPNAATADRAKRRAPRLAPTASASADVPPAVDPHGLPCDEV